MRAGQRVTASFPSRAKRLVTLFACARNGYVCMPSLHQNYTVAEIATLLERSRAARSSTELRALGTRLLEDVHDQCSNPSRVVALHDLYLF